MKTKLTILIIILCSTFATTSVFGTSYSWTGGGDQTNVDIAANWGGTLPATGNNDTAEWDGLTTSNLFLINNTANFASGPGGSGINLYLTANQTNSVKIESTLGTSQGMAVYNVTIDAGAAALTFGGTDTSRLFYMPQRPSGVTHNYVNNSTNPATINPRIQYKAGGGSAYTIDFSGTGNWIVNNYLQPDNSSGGVTVQVDGPGKVIWNPTGYYGSDAINAINITAGTLVLAGPHAKLNSKSILVNGTFEFNAPSQSQTLSGVIGGNGTLQMSAGTLTLQGQNTYTGTNVLTGGVLIVNSAENPGSYGPLGVPATDNTISFQGGLLKYGANSFDYSPRFSTNAGQAYWIDAGGQSVTFANGLTSSGGTLTVDGSGTLTLAGTNTYSGLTTVNAGNLVFQGLKTGSGNITVANDAALGVTEISGAQITPSTLTLGTSKGAILGFYNVTNTATAPLAPNTLSSGGTQTININSGTFTSVGQHFPLLTWTTGSAPGVSLDDAIGAAGNLTTNGNTIQFDVTALALTWAGTNGGDWTNANNWKIGTTPQTYTNPAPVVFNDQAAGTTTVTVDGQLTPSRVDVNNSSLPYSIVSSSGNYISGSTKLIKNGTNTLTLSGGVNDYTGATKINGGTVSVGTLTNGGSASDIGAASSSAASLLLSGGTLQYTGSAVDVDRLFTLGTGGGTIDASGSGALALTNTGSVGLSGVGTRALTLAGTLADTNTLAAVLSDSTLGATALKKSGTGTWVLTGNNANSGPVTINGGTLQVGAGGASGSLGSGTVTDDGTLIFNRTGTLTNSAISGSGTVTVQGGGTLVLASNNGYQGGTTISSNSTLQFGTGGATGTVYGNAPIVDNGLLIFNTTSAINISGYGNNISGTGNMIVRAGTVTSSAGNTYTGWTEIDSGATLIPCVGQTGGMLTSVITNNGTLKFSSQNTPATFGISNNIVGTGRVWMDIGNQNAGWAVLAGTNTYTGGTFIGGGGIVLGDGINTNAGTIVGRVVFTNTTGPTVNTFTTSKRLIFNRPDDFTFTNTIISAVSDGSSAANSGSLEQDGPGMVTLTGNNSYPGDTTISNDVVLQVGNGGTSGNIGSGPVNDTGTLIFNRSDNVTFTNVISGSGSLMKQGAGILTLTAANQYTGTNTVSNGTLIINNDNYAISTIVVAGTLGGNAAFYGPVTLNAGTTLAPGASVGTLTVNSDLSIGGNVAIEVNKSLAPSNDLVVVSGVLTNTGTGTLTVSNLGPALVAGDKFTLFSQAVSNGAALTVTGGGATWANNLAVDGSITVTLVGQPTLNFTNMGNGSLQFSWTASGYKLQAQTNSLSVGLGSNWADYPGGGTSPVTVSMDRTKGAIFFRLVSTP